MRFLRLLINHIKRNNQRKCRCARTAKSPSKLQKDSALIGSTSKVKKKNGWDVGGMWVECFLTTIGFITYYISIC